MANASNEVSRRGAHGPEAGYPHGRNAVASSQPSHDVPHRRPEVDVLVGVEVGERQTQPSHHFELGGEFPLHVGLVDAARRHPSQKPW